MTKPAQMAARAAWGFYINVPSIGAAASKVGAGGGQVAQGPQEVPGGQWMIQCVDPQGANFALVGWQVICRSAHSRGERYVISRVVSGAALVYHLFSMQPVAVATRIALPAAPALVVGTAKAAWLTPDGEIETLTLHAAAGRARTTPPFLCHAKAVARRLNIPVFPAYDVLELYAFTRPAIVCLPTPRGLARALDLAPPGAGIEAEAACADRRRRGLAAGIVAITRSRGARHRASDGARRLGLGRGGAERRWDRRRRRGQRPPA